MQLTESQREALANWKLHLQDEMDLIELAPGEPHRFLADPELLTDWIWAENSITTAVLEERIQRFDRWIGWGKLTAAEEFYLLHRLRLAIDLLGTVLGGRLDEQVAALLEWPDEFGEDAPIRKWLLIEVWDRFCGSYLEHWVRSFLAGTEISQDGSTWRMK